MINIQCRQVFDGLAESYQLGAQPVPCCLVSYCFTDFSLYQTVTTIGHNVTRMPSIMKYFAPLLLVSLLCTACNNAPDDGRLPVDTLFHNGKVVTIDANLAIASAVAVSGNTIVAVGGEELLGRYVADSTQDLAGKVLMPGFIDSHTHIRGRPERYIDLTKTTSIDEIKGLVQEKALALGKAEWVTGYGWSEDFMAELRRPLRRDLDEAAPENPVLLTRAGGHSAVANSMALRMAEVDANTPQPEGGVIEHGEDVN
jgi:hypothetical protein